MRKQSKVMLVRARLTVPMFEALQMRCQEQEVTMADVVRSALERELFRGHTEATTKDV